MSRYNKNKVINNNSPLANSRGANSISHYGLRPLKNLTVSERTQVVSISHMWSPRDKLYNLSYKYYGDPRYWWVIAWYNGKPTEADFYSGEVIEIPTSIEQILNLLEV